MIRTSLQPNPPILEGTVNELTVTYDVTSYTPTQIVGSYFDLSQILLMVIDDVPLSTPVSTRRFSSLGTHSVRIIFNDSFDNCSYLFDGCSSIVNVDLENFDTSNILYMCAMFRNCANISNLDLSNFDTSKVKSMSYMFDGCANISSADISQFDTSNTHSMTHMFHGCSSLTKVYLYGDLSNLNDCSDMFADIDTVGKFYYVDNVNYDLVVKQLPPSWKLCDNVIVATYTVAKDTTSATKLIGNSKLLDKISTMSINDVLLDAPIDSYTFENLSEDDDTTDFIVKMQLGCQFKELSGMFSNCKSLTNVDLSRLDASQVTSMVRMFSGCSALTSIDLLPLDTSNVTDMSYMLLGCISVETIDMSGMLFPKCKDMTRLFMSCLKLKELNMSGTQFENLNSHEMYIFYNCLSLETVDMSNMTFNVKTISNFFYSSSPLKTVSLNGFRSNATYIDDFLYQNKSIENLDVSNMYLPNAVRLRRFVTECSSLKELDFSGSYFPKITEAYQIFASCTSLTKVSNLSMPSVEDVSGMFSKCSNLQVIDLLVELNF